MSIRLTKPTLYGVLINMYCKLYNPDLGAAITCRGRTIISISALTVESVLNEYFPKKFEALNYVINEIQQEKNIYHKHLYRNIKKELNLNEATKDITLIEEIIKHLGLTSNYYMIDAIVNKLKNLDIKTLVKLYYKNNIKAFLKLDIIQKLFIDIMEKLNKEREKTEDAVYINPYEPPQVIQKEINKLKSLTEKILCGYYWYEGDYIDYKDTITNNPQETIKGINRDSVLLIDTDSNIIYIQDLNDKINDMYGDILTNFSKDELWFTLSNISTTIVTSAIDYSLERYKDHVNILDEYKPRINMKNEYLYKRFVLTSRKKNYLGTIKLKEGMVYKKDKLDTKGLSFTKSNFNQSLCDNVEEIVENDIMKSENIDLKNILKRLRNIDNEVLKKMKSEKAKEFFDIHKLNGEFDDFPISDHRVNAVKLWNYMNFGDTINAPSTFYTAYINLTETKDIKEKFPKEFEKLSYYLIDKMYEINENKLNGIRKDVSNEIGIKYDNLDFIDLKEKGKKRLMYKGEIEIQDNSIFLYISDTTDIAVEKLEIIMKKFNSKFRSLYNLRKSNKTVNMMDTNIMLLNDGERVYIKINDIYNKGLDKMSLDILEIYVDAYRLISNEYMKNKGEKIYQKLLNMGVDEKTAKSFGFKSLTSIKKKYKKIKKIALPLDITVIPDFILEYIDPTPVLSQTSNLIAPVIDSLGLITLRDKKDRRHVTNVIDYY